MRNVELKTWNYFCFPVYELRFLTQFPHIAPTGPNTFLNRYNLTLRWSWHLSMVLIDVKYVAEDWITSRVFQPMVKSIWAQFLQNCHNAQNAKKQIEPNPAMALRIWVRTCLKVNHGVGDFGLLFMCPSLDYSVSPNCPIVPSTLEQMKIHPQIALSLD